MIENGQLSSHNKLYCRVLIKVQRILEEYPLNIAYLCDENGDPFMKEEINPIKLLSSKPVINDMSLQEKTHHFGSVKHGAPFGYGLEIRRLRVSLKHNKEDVFVRHGYFKGGDEGPFFGQCIEFEGDGNVHYTEGCWMENYEHSISSIVGIESDELLFAEQTWNLKHVIGKNS